MLTCMFSIRNASLDDVMAIASVMRESVEAFGRDVYTPLQIASALRYICRPDEQLIIDGTYFVAVEGDAILGCGGWSRRRKVYSGSAASGNEDELLDPLSEPARIRSMFVHPSFGRRGIGRAILQHSEQRGNVVRVIRLHRDRRRPGSTGGRRRPGVHVDGEGGRPVNPGVILSRRRTAKDLKLRELR